MSALPKNITLVSYKNKDGSKQLKYRVRLRVKGVDFGELFDGLPEAKAYLLEIRSKYGRKALSEQELDEQKALAEYKKPTFEKLMEAYFNYKYPEDRFQQNPMKRKQFATYKSFKKTIINTRVQVVNETLLRETPDAAAKLYEIGLKKALGRSVRLGDLKPAQITYKTINSYITTRCEMKKSLKTVMKEVSIISCCFDQVRHVPTIAADWTDSLVNPTKDIDKSLLDPKKFEARKPLKKRIDDANFEKIKNCLYVEDLDFSYTLLLQYFGALRMGEAVFLEWENVDFEHKRLILPQTKTNPREVSMTKDLEDLLETIEPDPSKRTGLVVRTQTYYKYQKQVQRFRKKYGFELVTHTLRKDAISRMIDRVGGGNSIVLAEILGFKNVKNFETNHLEQGPDLSTVEGVMRSIGHTEKSKNITKNNYYALPKFTYKTKPVT